MKTTSLASAVAAAMMGVVGHAHAAGPTALDPVVITAPVMTSPLEVVLDPKAPQQPVPANDGASFLKNIPGFSLIRKGGTDGDPVFRGSAASRLNILLDGMEFHGGCSSRMDPPTAYVFPESFDQVTVIKGPQTVRYGNGNAAGVVLFEHDRESVVQGNGGFVSGLGGSWGRIDGVINARTASEAASLSATITHAQSDNYNDGSGKSVHSAYQRKSATFLGGVQINADTRLDLDGVVSKGEAAYADRTMDGTKFDRESLGFALHKKNLTPVVQGMTARVYHSYIDHVMDDYSLRGFDGNAAVMNPDRVTDGARFAVDLVLSPKNRLHLGMDWRSDEHTSRNKMGMAGTVYTADQADLYVTQPRLLDYKSRFTGVFGEWTHELNPQQRLISGVRLDRWSADRWFVNMTLMNNSNTQIYQGSASDTLHSAFLRLEQELSSHAKGYVGFGLNQRPMDYWEANRFEGITANAPAVLKPESTRQLDTGILVNAGRVKGSVSLFYAKVDNAILVYTGMQSGAANNALCQTTSGLSNVRHHNGMMSCVASGNIDATRYGVEADLTYRITDSTTLRGTLAYVHATNDTFGVPLAQTPPMEVKLGVDHAMGEWRMGGIVRAVTKQDRIHANYGTVVGVDRAVATPGFVTLGLHAGYKPSKMALVSVGVDNVFDRNYYEHMSRTDAAISGYVANTQTAVNEPGRTYWLKGQVLF